MKTALGGGKNKQHQTHTKTLETNTIRTKSWRQLLSFLTSTPAYLLYAAGFFITLSLPVLASDHDSDTTTANSPDTAVLQANVTEDSTSSTDGSSKPDDAPALKASAKSTTSSSLSDSTTSISIDMSVSSSSDDEDETNPETTVSINGQAVELPSNGRFNEKFKDDNNSTRLRGKIDADNGASIRISTDSNIRTEGD